MAVITLERTGPARRFLTERKGSFPMASSPTSGDRYNPDQQPDEVPATAPDRDQPSQTPDEVSPGQGDFDRPDSAPSEVPQQPGAAPAETPPPAD
jgi:hypothetical protein